MCPTRLERGMRRKDEQKDGPSQAMPMPLQVRFPLSAFGAAFASAAAAFLMSCSRASLMVACRMTSSSSFCCDRQRIHVAVPTPSMVIMNALMALDCERCLSALWTAMAPPTPMPHRPAWRKQGWRQPLVYNDLQGDARVVGSTTVVTDMIVTSSSAIGIGGRGRCGGGCCCDAESEPLFDMTLREQGGR